MDRSGICYSCTADSTVFWIIPSDIHAVTFFKPCVHVLSSISLCTSSGRSMYYILMSSQLAFRIHIIYISWVLFHLSTTTLRTDMKTIIYDIFLDFLEKGIYIYIRAAASINNACCSCFLLQARSIWCPYFRACYRIELLDQSCQYQLLYQIYIGNGLPNRLLDDVWMTLLHGIKGCVNYQFVVEYAYN
jgi:hypothetical protein